MADETNPDISTLTVQLLSAFVSKNSLPSDQLAELIKTTRAALTEDITASSSSSDPEEFTPAVSVRKSLASPDHILSLIDGKPYKTLKRHLATHGLTPEEYRLRYKLPASYPMVAASYSQARRAVAQKLRLGHKPSTVAAPAQPTQTMASSDPTPKASDAPATSPVATDMLKAQAAQPQSSVKKPRTAKLRLSFKDTGEEPSRKGGDENGPVPAPPAADDRSAPAAPSKSAGPVAGKRVAKRRSPRKAKE